MLKSILTNKVELPLGQVIHMLSHEYNEQTVTELTRNYILTSTSSDISKKGLEFLYMNGFYEDLRFLIKKNLNSTSHSNRKWAAVYRLLIGDRYKRYTPQVLLQQLNDLRIAEPELNCVAEFMKITVFFDIKDYERVGSYLATQTQLIKEVEDDFLHSSFNLRLSENLFTYYWIKNELIMARKYAYRALNKTTSAKVKATIHNNLGLTYVFDTYYQGMYHLSKALNIAQEHHLTDLIHTIEQRDIPFLSAHFNKTDGIESSLNSEQAYIEIAKGNYSKAITLLRDLPMDNPFTLYYKGIATRDKQVLTQAYDYFFEKESNYFYCRLPLRALKKMEVC